jgi:ABC-type uncharacterized transport system permease subunit
VTDTGPTQELSVSQLLNTQGFPASFHWILVSICLIGYAGMSFIIFQSRFENVQERSSKKLALLSSVPLIAHGLFVLSIISQSSGIYFNLVNIVCLIAWLMAGMTVFSSLYRPTINLCLFAFPIALVSVLLVILFPSKAPPLASMNTSTLSHVVISLLAFSVFSISAGQALFIASFDYQLRHKLARSWHNTFPPLQTLEKSLFEMISLGMVLLSLSILSGFLFLDNIFEQHLAHKLFFSVISWMVFCALLIGRIKLGWRGSRAIQIALSGYALLFLAFIGSKFVLEILLERT